MLKRVFFSSMFILIAVVVIAALPRVSNPEPASQTELDRAKFNADAIEAVWPAPKAGERIRSRMILRGEKVIFEDGPIDLIMNTHSMRKSVLSILYGIAVDKGLIDLDKTLHELAIDEVTPLTEQEKTATIRDLLMFRSGIYLPAAGEHDSQITDRPKRGQHKPNEYFFSNNFDANALGTIFTQETGYQIGIFMDTYLARPLGMQDFNANNVIMGGPWFWPSKNTLHLQYYMYLSTRDFARIGAMIAQGGRWNGKQIVSQDWIALSTAQHSDLTDNHIKYTVYDGAGYLWWLDSKNGRIWTDGYGGHFMLIDPVRDITIIERNFTGNSYLSTLRWLKSDNKFSHTRSGLGAAHKVLIENLE